MIAIGSDYILFLFLVTIVVYIVSIDGYICFHNVQFMNDYRMIRNKKQVYMTSKPSNTNNVDRLNRLKKENNIFSKILFSSAEYFGKLTNTAMISNNKDKSINIKSIKTIHFSSLSLDKKASRIREEYEKVFWATGNMDLSLWEENCTFADPFSSFGGDESLKRFKSNADNLGKFVNNPISKVTNITIIKSSNQDDSDVIQVGWIFSSKLKLPWKPILAASGETNHYISKQSGKICRYEERWKSKPIDVIKRLFVPTQD